LDLAQQRSFRRRVVPSADSISLGCFFGRHNNGLANTQAAR
jgi:hypothetical protein